MKSGSWALVTGASDGIGKALTEKLAEAGCNLVLVARRQELLQELANHFKEHTGVQTRVISADLSSLDETARVIREVEDLEIDILVNAAGFGTSGDFENIELAKELSMLEVNCRATLQLTHAFAQKMISRRRGNIVFLSSLVAFQGVPRAAHYAATKAYIQTFGEGLQRELTPKGVKILIVAPGPVKSGFAARAHMNMDRASTPEEVAKGIFKSLNKSGTIRPGFLSKLLGYSLVPLGRSLRTTILAGVMAKMTQGHSNSER